MQQPRRENEPTKRVELPDARKAHISHCLRPLYFLGLLVDIQPACGRVTQPAAVLEDTLFLRHSYDCTDIDNYGASIGYKYDTRKCTPGKVQDFWWYGTWNPFIPQGDEEVSLLTQGSTLTCTPAFTPTCTRPHARINQWRCFVNIPKFYPSKPPIIGSLLLPRCVGVSCVARCPTPYPCCC